MAKILTRGVPLRVPMISRPQSPCFPLLEDAEGDLHLCRFLPLPVFLKQFALFDDRADDDACTIVSVCQTHTLAESTQI